MTPYHAQHAALFRTVADILVRDYIAPSETAETVAEWCSWVQEVIDGDASSTSKSVTLMEPSELAALIADIEGYEKKEARK